jgi:hypothetical protein
MKPIASSLAPMLRSDTQGRLLARVLVDETNEYSLTQLVEWTASSMPTVLREVDRAELAGIVRTRKVGPTRLVQANPTHALFSAIKQIIVATYGPPAIIETEFANLTGADAVLIYGSWTARYLGEPGRAPSDIDVLVLGDLNLNHMHDAAEKSEHRIGLPVQATARSTQAWLKPNTSFMNEVRSRPIIALLINPDHHDLATDLAHLTTRRSERLGLAT